MMAWISPGKTVSETPFKIGRLSVDAERFSTSKIGYDYFILLYKSD